MRTSSGGGRAVGWVSHRGEYDPFGNVRDESGPARSEFGYADEQRDGETGLVNLRARYYDPGLGRFLSRDAFGGLDADPQGWNRYSYVENNPVTRTDPSGHYGRGLPNAQVRALQQDWRAGRFSSESLAQIRRLTKDQYRWATAGLPRGVKKRLDRIAEPNEKEDDSKRSRLRKSCSNPGQYTGSCPGGPPNPAYIADQLAAEQAKLAGRAAQERREVADNATPSHATEPDAGPAFDAFVSRRESDSDGDLDYDICLDLTDPEFLCNIFIPQVGPGGTLVLVPSPAKDLTPPLSSPGGGSTRGGAVQSLPSLDDLSRAAAALDRNGLTKAGRALQKHSSRAGSDFQKPPDGRATSYNEVGQYVVDEILTTPGTRIRLRQSNSYGPVIEVRTTQPNGKPGRGVLYRPNGDFIGFREPSR